MQLRIQHCFPASLDAVVDTLQRADYAAHLCAGHRFFAEVSVLSLRVTRTRIERSVRYRGHPFIARLGPFSPAPEWFVWVERSVFDREAARLTFENEPVLDSVRARFENRGSMAFRERVDERGATTTVRDASFQVDFHVSPLYRPLRELALQLVARQLTSSLDEEAALLARWLERDCDLLPLTA